MAAKEMTVRACCDGGFVVYDRIQMVQNPDPIAAFGEIRPALDFVLKAMVPAVAVDRDVSSASLEAQHLREVERAVRTGAGSLKPTPGPFDYVVENYSGRPVPRDEPLMEDDRS